MKKRRLWARKKTIVIYGNLYLLLVMAFNLLCYQLSSPLSSLKRRFAGGWRPHCVAAAPRPQSSRSGEGWLATFGTEVRLSAIWFAASLPLATSPAYCVKARLVPRTASVETTYGGTCCGSAARLLLFSLFVAHRLPIWRKRLRRDLSRGRCDGGFFLRRALCLQ